MSEYEGLGKKVKVRYDLPWTGYWPYVDYKFGYCASAPFDGEMCIQFENGDQEWHPYNNVQFLE